MTRKTVSGTHPRAAFVPCAIGLLLVACARAPVAPTAAPAETTPAPTPAGAAFEADLLQYPSVPAAPADLDALPLYRVLVAEFAGQRDRLPVAVEQYAKVASATRDPVLTERATKIALYARDDVAALAAAERWVALEPGNLEARQIAAAMHVRAGHTEPAIAHLQYVLANDRGPSGQKLKMIANLLGREEDKATALAVMQRLVDARTGDPDTLLVYAVLALRADKLEASRTAMEQLVAKADINPNIALAYVAALQKQGHTKEAARFLDRALARTPQEFGLRLLYARMLADDDQFERAREEFLRLNRQAPDSTDVLFALGLLNLQTDRVDEAAQNFTAMSRSPERRDDAYFYLGQIAETRGRPAEALAAYREVSGGSSLFQAQVRTAVLLASDKRVDEARAVLARLRPETDEQRRQAVLVEAEILAEQKEYANAMAVFDKALNGTYDATLLYSRAMLAERMNRLDVLEADLREILKREPENSDALNALGYTLADRTARYEEAHALIRRALELTPDNFYVLDSMGWVLYRLGRLEEAVPYLQKARAQRNDPEVAAHLGEVLWALGRRDDAREVWDSALQTHPADHKILDAIKRLTE
ncbi:MAG: tetratricopeptide repeat protein [Gammaproteobacteria bacterium]